MNIVILPSWFRRNSNQILGSFFMEQAVAMAKLGHRVIIIDADIIPTRTYFRSELTFGIKHYFENNVEIYSYKTCALGLGRFPNLFTQKYTNKVKKILLKILQDMNIDIIHAQSFYPAAVAAMQIKQEFNIPYVITEHYSKVITNPDKRMYNYFVPTIEQSSGYSCVSYHFCDKIRDKYNITQDIQVIPNVLNSVFDYCEPVINETFRFVSVGRLIQLKNMDKLLLAFNDIIKLGYNAKLTIVGDGKEKSNLLDLTKKLNLDNFVEFKGNLSRNGVYKAICKSNTFVLLSSYENFGVSYMEALATGRPIIATANGAAYEHITNDNGIIVEHNNHNDLVNAMIFMMQNYDNYDLKNISKDCINKFSEQRVAEQYEAFYQKAINKYNNIK